MVKKQSTLTYNVIHKSLELADNFTFQQSEILIDKPIDLKLDKFVMRTKTKDKQKVKSRRKIWFQYCEKKLSYAGLKTKK